MIRLSFSEINTLLEDNILQNYYHGRRTLQRFIDGFSIDSRNIEKNNLFCALSGTQTDGHHFLMDAYQKGASGALVTKINTQIPDDFPQWLVHDVPTAMGLLARSWR